MLESRRSSPSKGKKSDVDVDVDVDVHQWTLLVFLVRGGMQIDSLRLKRERVRVRNWTPSLHSSLTLRALACMHTCGYWGFSRGNMSLFLSRSLRS